MSEKSFKITAVEAKSFFMKRGISQSQAVLVSLILIILSKGFVNADHLPI